MAFTLRIVQLSAHGSGCGSKYLLQEQEVCLVSLRCPFSSLSLSLALIGTMNFIYASTQRFNHSLSSTATVFQQRAPDSVGESLVCVGAKWVQTKKIIITMISSQKLTESRACVSGR